VESRNLGRSGVKASLVGLGCNNFGMKIDLAASRAVIDAALDAGINFFDTADMYGNGKSEEFLGEVLVGRRNRVVLATKFGGMAFAGRTGERFGAREYVRKCVEASLARLRTDHIDLYQMHYPDPQTPVAETLGALSELVNEGKVRAIGCSNFTGPQLDESAARGAEKGGARFETAQNEWSLLVRGAEADVIPACDKHGLSQLPYFPLASGVLTGKYKRGQDAPAGSRIAVMSYFKGALSDANLTKVEALEKFASARGRRLLELAFSWLASHPCVGSVIAGATTPEQVRANAQAADWRLTKDELAEIDRLSPR
jgi:aryl-alcohol dehydrogenase-like predicted oxidoreductase